MSFNFEFLEIYEKVEHSGGENNKVFALALCTKRACRNAADTTVITPKYNF